MAGLLAERYFSFSRLSSNSGQGSSDSSTDFRSPSLLQFPALEGFSHKGGISGVVRCLGIKQSVARRIISNAHCMGSGPGIGRDAPDMKDAEGGRGKRSLGKVRAEATGGVVDGGLTKPKLAVFVSGGGSNFRALHTSTLRNIIHGDISLVVSDKPECGGCKYAVDNGIPVVVYPISKKAPDGLSAPDLVATLKSHGIDFILLAGYLKLLPADVVGAYPRSVLNIHPALLPSFGGKGYFGTKLHAAVIKSGARYSGATIHFVDENFDSGPILAQRIVPVLSDDTPQTLAARILEVEHVLYSEAVAALCEDRIVWREDGVPLIKKSWEGAAAYY